MYLSFGYPERGKQETLSIKAGDLQVRHVNRMDRQTTFGIGKKHALPEKRGSGSSGGPDDFSSLDGLWVAKYSNSVIRVYAIGSNGGMLLMDDKYVWEGQVMKAADHFLFTYEGHNEVERARLLEGKLRIDHFNPSASYPDGQPKLVALGARLSK
jgi:hypothetical protein